MPTFRLLLALVTLFFCCVFANASDKVKPPKPAKPPKIPSEWYDPKKLIKRVVFLDRELEKAVSVDQIVTNTTSDPHLHLIGFNATFRNRTHKDLTLLIQAVFKDKGGKELNKSLDKSEDFNVLLIPALGSANYEAQTGSDKAMRFLIRLKPLTKPRL